MSLVSWGQIKLVPCLDWSFQMRVPHPQVLAVSDVGLEQTWSDLSFSYIRQLLLEEKEGLLGDIAFLQVQ